MSAQYELDELLDVTILRARAYLGDDGGRLLALEAPNGTRFAVDRHAKTVIIERSKTGGGER